MSLLFSVKISSSNLHRMSALIKVEADTTDKNLKIEIIVFIAVKFKT
jgi:hypothetical protein